MPLNKPKLISAIKTALEKSHARKNSKHGIETLANELGKAIDTYIREADVQTNTTGTGVVAPGIAVTTFGSSVTQTGTTTVTGISSTTGKGVGKVV
tara:strand:+ start:618 stop:905 length:288 start_codon:yes stop_codon:yes gene_type:complete